MPARASLRLVASGAVASLAIALSLAPLATRASAESEDASATTPVIYKWVDENGIAHYTTDRARIPGEIRDRVESRNEVATKNPASAGQPTREDLMRDAVPKQPGAGTSLVAPAAAAATVADVPPLNPGAPDTGAAEIAAPAPSEAVEFEETSIETTEIESAPLEAIEPAEAPEQYASPAPLSRDVQDETSAVSAPPPAPPAPIGPGEQAELDELDQQIDAVLDQIGQREETLAVLISSSDDQRAMAIVDDPQFREISQSLPKLQADLQTLRERRNKIQPAATTP
jgi:hypothetical protein